jgi:hypothetical protein
MLRNITLMLLVVALTGWPQQVSDPAVEAARRADAYSIYSNLLINSFSSDPTMMIAAKAIPGASLDPQECVNLPSEYQSRWNEVLMDFTRGKRIQETIEPAFKISKPYLVLTPDEVADFTFNWGKGPAYQKPLDPKFQGARQLYLLGKVYFSLDHTLALTSISIGCGSLCGTSGWRVFEKNRTGDWVLMTRRVGIACGDSRA